jgi:diadenosine tetraphosphate (Ap4A) HIT family hydrolase
MFELHPRLAADTLPVTDLKLCSVRLMNDSRFPWLILVPRRVGAVEVHHLPAEDQALLMQESSRAAAVLDRLFAPDKMNIGSLGNVVEQLHWHVVARSRSDACWPGPVWGCGKTVAYGGDEGEARAERIAQAFE